MTILCPACLIENTPGLLTCSVCGYDLSDSDDSNGLLSIFPLALLPDSYLKQGAYQVEEPLGQGGFGIAYRVCRVADRQTLVIKEFFPERSSRQGNKIIWPANIPPKDRKEYIQAFFLEYHNLSRCCPYPNIVQSYEWFEENNTGYIVLELVPGDTLEKVLKKDKKLSEDKVKRYFIQIANALKVVHQNKLLHRDIKPENIIINPQDEAVLIDFGNAREYIAGKTQSMTAIATVGYAPLEQLTSYAKRSPSIDFYAVCATMYELLTGQLPASSTDRVHEDKLIPPRSLVPSISPQMNEILLTGLKMRAEDRFQTADELISALQGNFISPALCRARKFANQRNFPEAIKAYQGCLQGDLHNISAIVELAMILVYFNEKEAENIAIEAIKIDVNDGRIYGVLGLIYCRRGDWSDALSTLKKAIIISPKESWIQSNLAWAAGKNGDWELARKSIKIALELDNNSPFILGIQAWIAFHDKDWRSVIRFARPAIFKAKQLEYSKNLYSWIYPYLVISLGKIVTSQHSTDVERCLEEYMDQIPSNPLTFGLIAWEKVKKNQLQEALVYFKEANQYRPMVDWILFNEAILQEKSGNISEAIKVYEICLSNFIDSAFVYLRCGTLSAKNKNFQQAKLYLEKALVLKQNNPEIYHNLGWVLLSLNIENDVTEYNQEIILYYKKSILLYEQIGKTHFSQSIKQAFHKAGIIL